MEGAVSETMQAGGSGVKAEPGKMHASKSEVHTDRRSTCRARARMQEVRKRARGEKKKGRKEKTERAWISRHPCQGKTSGPWHRCERHPVQASARSIAEKGGATWSSG